MKNLLLILLAVALFGCKKKNLEDYKGDTGTTGADAAVTVVNVNVQPGDWTLNGSYYRAILFIDKITQAIYEKGSVQVYSVLNNQIKELPFLEGENYMRCAYTTGRVNLYFGDSHVATPPTEKPEAQTIRIVIHPATK